MMVEARMTARSKDTSAWMMGPRLLPGRAELPHEEHELPAVGFGGNLLLVPGHDHVVALLDDALGDAPEDIAVGEVLLHLRVGEVAGRVPLALLVQARVGTVAAPRGAVAGLAVLLPERLGVAQGEV